MVMSFIWGLTMKFLGIKHQIVPVWDYTEDNGD